MINIDGRIIVDERQVPLAKIHDFGKFLKVRRLPACTIGDYFVILNWLNEWGYNAI